MPLGLAFGFAMVEVSFESLITTIPTKEIYMLFMSAEVFCTPVLFGSLAHSTKFHWALSDQKGMSYLAKTKSLTKRAYTDHKIYKNV